MRKSRVKEVEIAIHPDHILDEHYIQKVLAQKKTTLNLSSYKFDRLKRKSLDARSKMPVFRLRYELSTEEFLAPTSYIDAFKSVEGGERVNIVGAGPAGYFAALQLIELGLKPIVLERGFDVRERRRDLRAIQQFGKIHPDSNYCFGEGGAGTYSDGKLYTRSHKRGRIQKILELLVEHGAKKEILTDAHAHIGSNKLPKIIAAIRQTILGFGGEIHFNTKIVDMIIENEHLLGVKDQNGRAFMAKATILATGHSARDIFLMLHAHGVQLEFKAFALGVRVEHPQIFIDQSMYHHSPRHENLGAAAYRLTAQAQERGVYSFCMCPGGLIVPASTAPGELVVNGMSLSKRDSPYSNSGVVVELHEHDIPDYQGVPKCFKGWEFQRRIEQKLFNHGDGSQRAPAQFLKDFMKGKQSVKPLPDSSYIPGLYSAPIHELLPDFIVSRLREGFREFNLKMKGYIHDQAILVGVESRTSSPVRIPRGKNFEHNQLTGLFPCGEGAGYAGGIISAALDGMNVAKAIYERIEPIKS